MDIKSKIIYYSAKSIHIEKFALHRTKYFILYILSLLDVCVTEEYREDTEMPLLILGVLFGSKFC